MNNLRVISMVFIYNLYKPLSDELSNTLETIHIEQMKLTGSPNFFFKGQTFYHTKRLPFKVISEDQVVAITAYIQLLAYYTARKEILTSLLTSAIGFNKNPALLFHVLPTEAHYLIDTMTMGSTPEEIATLNLSKVDEIHTIIKEQLTYSLIN